MKIDNKKWWGEFAIETGDHVEWRIGPLHTGVKRRERELLVFHREIEVDDMQPERPITYSDLDIRESENSNFDRFVFQSAPQSIMVLPALADRPVVSRPFTPLAVAAGEKTAVHVGTPLWFTLSAGEPPDTFFEMPIQRPSDTWFGPSTLVGETCYASRTFARLNIVNMPPEPEWATTRIHIVNNSDDALYIERLNLPVPFLSLFQTEEGRLFTESVTMVQTQDDGGVEFTVDRDLAEAAAGAAQIAAPRQAAQKGMFVTAFGALKDYGIG